ncbi:hypothetical protein ES288_D04G079600v1 [Gossypium darwinii]|uniref:Myb-like domain-containing protein n=1 Tax=Gossypium darwinii TaxID=34276 RepID=A0A5D2CUC4_GOSDA|nr:hypothetical protein ES288_D04G079600v1 [Gossypium darwinii]
METFFATSFMSNSDWFDQEDISRNPYWTKEENKRFESALAIYGEDVPDRWMKVAAMIPGIELEEDVFDIESGRIPIPGYLTSSFTFEMVDNHDFEPYRKRSNGAKGPDHERKKGVPWTEEEHRRFLMGLMKNLVVSKTPTQVASHAQKYFQRQLSGGKDKKRPSIHDITTLSITTPNTGFSDNQSDHVLALHQKLSSTLQKADHNNDASAMALNSSQEGWFTSSQQYLTASNGLRFEGQNLYGNGFHGAQPPQSSVF